MNTGTFAGNIGRDAETKTVGDTTVTNFSLAVNTGFGDKKSTLWVGCAMWGSRGQKLEQYLTSGTKVAVSGDIDVRAYSAKDGTPKAEMTCNVQRLTLQGGGGERQERPAVASRAAASGNSSNVDADFNDDLPAF
jgi:single-strand DNA-binding protein